MSKSTPVPTANTFAEAYPEFNQGLDDADTPRVPFRAR